MRAADRSKWSKNGTGGHERPRCILHLDASRPAARERRSGRKTRALCSRLGVQRAGQRTPRRLKAEEIHVRPPFVKGTPARQVQLEVLEVRQALSGLLSLAPVGAVSFRALLAAPRQEVSANVGEVVLLSADNPTAAVRSLFEGALSMTPRGGSVPQSGPTDTGVFPISLAGGVLPEADPETAAPGAVTTAQPFATGTTDSGAVGSDVPAPATEAGQPGQSAPLLPAPTLGGAGRDGASGDGGGASVFEPRVPQPIALVGVGQAGQVIDFVAGASNPGETGALMPQPGAVAPFEPPATTAESPPAPALPLSHLLEGGSGATELLASAGAPPSPIREKAGNGAPAPGSLGSDGTAEPAAGRPAERRSAPLPCIVWEAAGVRAPSGDDHELPCSQRDSSAAPLSGGLGGGAIGTPPQTAQTDALPAPGTAGAPLDQAGGAAEPAENRGLVTPTPADAEESAELPPPRRGVSLAPRPSGLLSDLFPLTTLLPENVAAAPSLLPELRCPGDPLPSWVVFIAAPVAALAEAISRRRYPHAGEVPTIPADAGFPLL